MSNSQAKFCFADFFAGPGGLSLGFEMTESFTPVYAVDADKDAAKTYGENRKGLDVEVHTGKISSVSPSDIRAKAKQNGFGGVDVMLAGPPCRPYSMANRSKENRWTRVQIPDEFRDLLNLVSELKPTAVVIENVGWSRRQDWRHLRLRFPNYRVRLMVSSEATLSSLQKTLRIRLACRINTISDY